MADRVKYWIDIADKASFLWTLERKASQLIEPVLLTEDGNNPLYYNIVRTGVLV